jgi:hypothetical protein
MPNNLNDHPRLQQRFLIEARPGYVVADLKNEPTRWPLTSEFVRPVGRLGDQVVLEVRDLVPRAIVWRQPPPLMCAGFGEECRRALNR